MHTLGPSIWQFKDFFFGDLALLGNDFNKYIFPCSTCITKVFYMFYLEN